MSIKDKFPPHNKPLANLPNEPIGNSALNKSEKTSQNRLPDRGNSKKGTNTEGWELPAWRNRKMDLPTKVGLVFKIALCGLISIGLFPFTIIGGALYLKARSLEGRGLRRQHIKYDIAAVAVAPVLISLISCIENLKSK